MMFSIASLSVPIADVFVAFSDSNYFHSLSVQEVFLNKKEFETFFFYSIEELNKNFDIEEFNFYSRNKNFKIKDLNLGLGTKICNIEELHLNLENKNSFISKLNLDIKNKNSEIEELHLDIENKDFEIEKLHLNLENKNSFISKLNLDIKNKDSEIEELHLDIENKDSEIEELHLDIENKDSEIKELSLNLENKDSEIKELSLNLENKDFWLKKILIKSIKNYLEDIMAFQKKNDCYVDSFFVTPDKFFFLERLCSISDNIFLFKLDFSLDKDIVKSDPYKLNMFNLFIEDPLNSAFSYFNTSLEAPDNFVQMLNLFKYTHLYYFKGILVNGADDMLQVIFQLDFFCKLQDKSHLDIISRIQWKPIGSFFLNLFKNFPDEMNKNLIEETGFQLLKKLESRYYFEVLNYDSRDLSLAKLKLRNFFQDTNVINKKVEKMSSIKLVPVDFRKEILNTSSVSDINVLEKKIYMLKLSDYSAFIKQDFLNDVSFDFYDCLEKIKIDAIAFEKKLVSNNPNLSTNIFRINKLDEKETFSDYFNRLMEIYKSPLYKINKT